LQTTSEQVISCQLTDAFHVKRSRVMDNLHILQGFHPSFNNANFQIDHNALNSLPKDGSLLDRLRSINDDTSRTSTTPSQMNENQGPDAASGEEGE
jgi:hypothetical protein